MVINVRETDKPIKLEKLTLSGYKAKQIYNLINEINRKERNSVRESSSTPEP